MITSTSNGHKTHYWNGVWYYSDTCLPCPEDEYRPCAKCGKESVNLELTTVASLSHTKKEYRRVWSIDACIADIVGALDKAGIKMRHSCCGHGENGDIILEDRRKIVIKKY